MPTSFTELAHIVVRARYLDELPARRALAQMQQIRPPSGWIELYKQDPSILGFLLPDFQRLRRLLTANRFLVLDPDDLGPSPIGRRFDDELVHTMTAYALDSSDAAILVEARRAGVADVATLDADLRRAAADFTIHTWL